MDPMWDTITNVVIPVIGTFVIGIAGWFLTHFIANPVLESFQIRKQVHESIFFTENVSETSGEQRLKESILELRRLAARLNALEHSLRVPVRWFLNRLGYDLRKASANLTGLSNSMHTVDGSKATHKCAIQNSLKIPLGYDAPPKRA